ncbi:MAG: DUF4445 domain-containing protein [Nitrospinae bacterium]|nr:DUF4445 domain-containing protein [Nitrospinota bacterium]
MNSLKRVQSVVRFLEADRPPVIPEVVGVTATLNGVAPREYAKSGEVIAQCQLSAQKIIGYDCLFAVADLCVEAEALGSVVAYPEDNYPYVEKARINDLSDFERLSVPDPNRDGRMPEIIKALKIMKAAAEGEIPVVAHVTGPMTLLSRTMEIEKMLYTVVDHPARFREMLEFCTAVCSSFAVELVKNGADGIIMLDPSSSPSVLPARIFREFGLKPVSSVFSAVKGAGAGALTWYSVAGPLTGDHPIFTSVSCDVKTVDYVVPIETAFEFGGSAVINGNIKPMLFLEGTPDDILAESAKLLDAARVRERFILGSGCEVPLNSSPENLRALVRAAEEEGRRFERSNGRPAGKHELTILPHRKKITVPDGANLMDVLGESGVRITGYCAKNGSCGKCGVVVKNRARDARGEGEGSAPKQGEGSAAEKLACRVEVRESMEIYVPHQSRILPDSVVSGDGYIKESIAEELAFYGFSGPVGAEGKKTGATYGLAVDVGTTTISAYLHDMESGGLICAGSVENPQNRRGGDVITRTAAVIENPSLLREMQSSLFEGINSITARFHSRHGVEAGRILDMVIVANPFMTHFFLGVSPESLAQFPFVPAVEGWISKTAADFRPHAALDAGPDCRVEILPGVGGFVGSDVVAGILACRLQEREETSLFVDVGTNGEVVLGNRDGLLCASVPAGPAFEGAGLSHGHVCRTGVIRSVKMGNDGEIRYETVGSAIPVGLCGSGIIDVLAAFVRNGVVDERGKFVGGNPRVADGRFELVPSVETAIHRPITVSTKDVEEMQKAKSALKTAVGMLMQEAGTSPGEIKNVFISGAFGVSIDVKNAVEIGMIPDFPRAAFTAVRNSAGIGARVALLSRGARMAAEAIPKMARFVDLSNHPDFSERFIDNMFFPVPRP